MDKTIVIPAHYSVMSMADLPDVCFVHPKARDIPGLVYYAPEVASDLVHLRMDYSASEHAGEPHEFSECLLVLGSIPHLTIQWSAAKQQFYFGQGCSGFWTFKPRNGACCVTIGDHATANGLDCTLDSNAYLSIGEDCMFSLCNVHVGDGRAVFDLNTLALRNVRSQPTVIIREHVWLGLFSSVMMGSDIGAGSVVATRAVVRDVFPPHSLLAGVPAKVVRSNISWTREHNGHGREEVTRYLQQLVE